MDKFCILRTIISMLLGIYIGNLIYGNYCDNIVEIRSYDKK